MCGIIGHIGFEDTKKILLDGLAELEYRGYDSAGIAILNGDEFFTCKAIGKLYNLQNKACSIELDGFSVGIGHTRWATHGKPTEQNAHPHFGTDTYIVHNGIIENYQELKAKLQAEGVKFLSQTDTEVFVHLFEQNLKTTTPFEAFEKTLQSVEGAYAILLATKQNQRLYTSQNMVLRL